MKAMLTSSSIAIAPPPDVQSHEQEEQAYVLLEGFKDDARREARSAILWGAGFVLFHVALVAFDVLDFSDLFRSILFILGVVSLGFGVWEYLQAKKLTAEDLAKSEDAKAFAQSISETKGGYTKAILACLIAVAAFQFVVGGQRSIMAAGLVKSAVWRGEVWRLFTCATLHGSFMHIWMNSQALWGLGKMSEALTPRACTPLVFLSSAVCGSVFSLLLLPGATSVGASGGIMGLVGFLAVFGHRRREAVPAGFFKSMMVNICLVGAVGLVGFAVIDNAAHLGGLLAGAACGAVLIKRAERGDAAPPGATIRRLGVAALLAVAAISLLGIVFMLR